MVSGGVPNIRMRFSLRDDSSGHWKRRSPDQRWERLVKNTSSKLQ